MMVLYLDILLYFLFYKIEGILSGTWIVILIMPEVEVFVFFYSFFIFVVMMLGVIFKLSGKNNALVN